MVDGRVVEALSVGREGMVGALGLDFSPVQTVCQVAGSARRIRMVDLYKLREASPSIRLATNRYSAFACRLGHQLTACNALHPVNRRAARWLLMAGDRLGRDEFAFTQESLANMLGVHRPTVSNVAGALQAEGLITYRRGVIRIADRPRLERAACECYRAQAEFYSPVPGPDSTLVLSEPLFVWNLRVNTAVRWLTIR